MSCIAKRANNVYPIQEVHVCVNNGTLIIREFWRRCAQFSAEMDIYEFNNPNASLHAGTIVKRYHDSHYLWNYLDHLNKSNVVIKFVPENSFYYIEKEDFVEHDNGNGVVNPLVISWIIAIMFAIVLFAWNYLTEK